VRCVVIEPSDFVAVDGIHVFAPSLSVSDANDLVAACVFDSVDEQLVASQTLAAARASFLITKSQAKKQYAATRPLTRSENKWVRELVRSDEHSTRYLASGLSLDFVVADLRQILGGQKWINVDRSHCKQLLTIKSVFELCTRWEPVHDPEVLSNGYVRFVSDKPNSPIVRDVRVVRASKGEVHVITSVVAAKNYMTLVPFEDAFLLTNGYHRAVACLRQGISEVFCRLERSHGTIAIPQGANFAPAALLAMMRPTLEDYLNPKYTVALSRPKTQNVVEVGYDIKRHTRSIGV